jgi:hypothetical protein
MFSLPDIFGEQRVANGEWMTRRLLAPLANRNSPF